MVLASLNLSTRIAKSYTCYCVSAILIWKTSLKQILYKTYDYKKRVQRRAAVDCYIQDEI